MADPTYKVTISGEDAQRLERLVESGQYPSPEAAVADALAELEGGAAAEVDAWLKSEIAARYDALAADPARAISSAEARKRLLGAG
jgi:antitoxin ParD1/3/4